MKLNNDAVRSVMLFIEDNLKENYILHTEIISGIDESKLYTKNDLLYAIDVLLTTDFLNIVERPIFDVSGNLLMVKIKGLTFSGCNFLDNIRKPEIWGTVKKKSKIIGEGSIRALSIAGAKLSESLLTDPGALHNFLEGIEKIENLLT